MLSISSHSVATSLTAISDIPDNIKGCRHLAVVDASINPLCRLPEGFTQLPTLTELYLNDTFLVGREKEGGGERVYLGCYRVFIFCYIHGLCKVNVVCLSIGVTTSLTCSWFILKEVWEGGRRKSPLNTSQSFHFLKF